MTVTDPRAAESASTHLHPGYSTGPRAMRVVEVRPLTETITHFRFVPLDAPGSMLTPFQPGSHVIVSAGEHRNAYSLVDDGLFPTSYGISVLRRGAGGGSDWLHDTVTEGTVLEIEGPRSMFAPITNQHHALLVAGGIGITPILSHARAIVRDGGTADIVYSYRPGHAAHLDEVRALSARDGITLHEATSVDETVAALRARFALQPLGTHAYACGPGPLLDSYAELAAAAGWPGARVHSERFTAPEQDPGEPFSVRIAATGETIDVPAGVSLLQRLLDNGIAVPNLCRQGVCGECRIPVSSGAVLHRDFVLSDEEKAAGDSMLCCVSRAQEATTELEVNP
ncbi:PDR/VanB family oxidoreductase [Gordonia sp. NB41Y]|uniref:PDR/VanB family oxidoreductase n=1 Tax=Gordonia sp. NB41Y TaxID=875808 RepID=UPI0006B1B694|nr:PDR/VanB family oxidoreductase [Gordonia sp. NB41Y]KOY50035.1 ferredoxin [Gordonia sp. NB41Y]WLP92911.1 PDR/VanB family oxidoreductase [Gordonia sp. NB41Y]